jgi:hypothetical protein
VGGKPHPSLTRSFVLSAPGSQQNLYFRAASAGKIEQTADGVFTVDGDWTLKVQSPGKPIVRTIAGRTELLVPVVFDGKQAKFSVEYVW